MVSSAPVIESFGRFLDSCIAAGVENIHVVTHSMGIRLFLSAMETKEIFERFNDLQSYGTQGKLNLMTTTFANSDYSVKQFRDVNYEALRNICSVITLYVDKGDNALKYSAMFTKTSSLGRLSTPFYTSSDAQVLLDVDIVDTSGLQDNMHSTRHSAFNVNRMMVEDLHDVIANRKRAKFRLSRLVNKKGNLFCFMTTPAAVTGNIV